jgi:predicted component of type VI protein secretion system
MPSNASRSTSPQCSRQLLARTLDIRLLALLAKLSIFNRGVAGLARRIGDLAWLLRERWEGVRPRAEGTTIPFASRN